MHMEEITLSNQVRITVKRIYLWKVCSTQIKPPFFPLNNIIFCNRHAVRFT